MWRTLIKDVYLQFEKFGCVRYPHNMENGGIFFVILLDSHFQ